MSLFARGPGPARTLRARVPHPRGSTAVRLTVPRLNERAGTARSFAPVAHPGDTLRSSAGALALGLATPPATSIGLRAGPTAGVGPLTGRAARAGHAADGEGVAGEAPAGVGAGRGSVPEDRASLRERLRAVLAPPVVALLPRAGSILHWPASLHPFQLDGVRVLLAKPEVLLADDMGLGKTVQAIAALRILLHRGDVETALAVVPASLIHQWRHELTRWAPELRVSTVAGSREQRLFAWTVAAHVFLVTYETLRSDFSPTQVRGPGAGLGGIVLLDEAQKVKNRDADVSAVCKMLPRTRSWALTGTPLENSVDDLASILEFLQPNPRGEPARPLRFDASLVQRHEQVQLRRRKMDVLEELPPKTVNRVLLDLFGEQRRSYERAEEEGVLELRRRGETIQLTHVLQLITRLKQVCNFCPETGASAKLADLAGRLEVLAAEGHKVLVFSQYTDEIFGVRAIAHGIGAFKPLTYTGELTLQERSRRIDRFKSDPLHRALVLSLRAGGQGLNLQEASYVVHFDRWWNPATERQAEDRSHRLGQTVPVTVYTYTCAGTIEERIAQLLEEKQRLFDLVVDEVSMDLDRLLTAEDLFGLFGLRPPGRPRGPEAKGRRSFAEMTGREFEEYVADLFRALGFSVELTPATRDRGVDAVARHVDVVGIETSLYIQCKNHASPVGVETVRALIGAVPADDPGARAVLVSPSGFSGEAARLARERGVQVVDERGLRVLAEQAARGCGR